MWPTSSVTRLGEIRHFGKIFKVLGNILTVYLLLGKFSGLLRQISYAIGQIFIDVNGQMLKNNLATWSHCRPDTHSCTVSIPNPSLSLSFMHTPTHIRIMKKHVLRGRQKIGGCGRDPFCFESGSFKDAHVGRRKVNCICQPQQLPAFIKEHKVEMSWLKLGTEDGVSCRTRRRTSASSLETWASISPHVPFLRK